MKLWIWKNTPGNCVPEPPSHDHLQNEKIKDKSITCTYKKYIFRWQNICLQQPILSYV